MTDIENHTIRLLQEMRNTMNMRFDALTTEMRDRFAKVDERFDRVDDRLDALENVFAGLSFITADGRAEIEAIKTRLDALEARP